MENNEDLAKNLQRDIDINDINDINDIANDISNNNSLNVISESDESEDDDISDEEEVFHCNVCFEELETTEINKIEKRMYPGKYSEEGFLQEGETLVDVYNNDRIFLENIGITYKQIYDKLNTIICKYYRSSYLDKKCLIEGKFKINIVCYNGAQRCPFQNKEKDKRYHGYEYGDQDITITNTSNNDEITFNTLLLHMIKKHHFFESPLSSHRLDPKKIIEFFELKSDINYKSESKLYNTWDDIGSDNYLLSPKYIDILTNIGLKTYELNNDIIGILLPFEFIFNDDFFINILIQDLNFSWKELLETNSYKLSKRKINYILKSIEEYKTNNDLSKMYLYLFNVSCNNKQIYKFNIEGIDIEYDSRYKLCYYRYITNKYIPLDEFDVLS